MIISDEKLNPEKTALEMLELIREQVRYYGADIQPDDLLLWLGDVQAVIESIVYGRE